MYFEINVAKNGIHFFATAERSARDEQKMCEIVRVFKEKFPESEGYVINVTRWDRYGTTIDYFGEDDTY